MTTSRTHTLQQSQSCQSLTHSASSHKQLLVHGTFDDCHDALFATASQLIGMSWAKRAQPVNHAPSIGFLWISDDACNTGCCRIPSSSVSMQAGKCIPGLRTHLTNALAYIWTVMIMPSAAIVAFLAVRGSEGPHQAAGGAVLCVDCLPIDLIFHPGRAQPAGPQYISDILRPCPSMTARHNLDLLYRHAKIRQLPSCHQASLSGRHQLTIP